MRSEGGIEVNGRLPHLEVGGHALPHCITHHRRVLRLLRHLHALPRGSALRLTSPASFALPLSGRALSGYDLAGITDHDIRAETRDGVIWVIEILVGEPREEVHHLAGAVTLAVVLGQGGEEEDHVVKDSEYHDTVLPL